MSGQDKRRFRSTIFGLPAGQPNDGAAKAQMMVQPTLKAPALPGPEKANGDRQFYRPARGEDEKKRDYEWLSGPELPLVSNASC